MKSHTINALNKIYLAIYRFAILLGVLSIAMRLQPGGIEQLTFFDVCLCGLLSSLSVLDFSLFD